MRESKLKDVQQLLKRIILSYDNSEKESAIKRIIEIVRDLESRIDELS
jgi:hypothetical protein